MSYSIEFYEMRLKQLEQLNAELEERIKTLVKRSKTDHLDYLWHLDEHGGGWNWCSCRGDAFKERYSTPLTYHHDKDCEWVKEGALIAEDEE